MYFIRSIAGKIVAILVAVIVIIALGGIGYFLHFLGEMERSRLITMDHSLEKQVDAQIFGKLNILTPMLPALPVTLWSSPPLPKMLHNVVLTC